MHELILGRNRYLPPSAAQVSVDCDCRAVIVVFPCRGAGTAAAGSIINSIAVALYIQSGAIVRDIGKE